MGGCPIYVRITVDGKRAEISLQRDVPEQFWDQSAQKVKGKHENSHVLNSYLDLIKGKIQSIYNQLLAANARITASLLKAKLAGRADAKEKTICDAFDFHNQKMAENIKVGNGSQRTLTRYEITKNKVIAFMESEYKAADKELNKIRLPFVLEFEHFLLTKQKLQVNTAHKYIKYLKKIINVAVGLEWIPSNPFTRFKCTFNAPEREVLTIEELNKLISKEINIDRIAEVRDVFVFSCYTGFAYIDVYNFEKDAVVRGLDGEYWLKTARQKTGTKESVPLLPIALKIIEKYRSDPYCIAHNKLLPVSSNQCYNAFLKELAVICDIKKNLTTHLARHTFATTITLANGVPLESVMSMLGHKNIRTTQIYAKVVEKKVSEDMKTLREKLKNCGTNSIELSHVS